MIGGGFYNDSSSCDPTGNAKGCSQWVADRNNGDLTPGCPVVANDVSWVVAGGTGTFTAIPTETGSLPEDGWYESPLLNPGEPWPARLNWDNCRIYWMADSTRYENEVRGDVQVQNFPWGNASVQRNTVDQANLNYSGGTLQDTYLGPQSNTVMSGGTLDETRIENDSNVTLVSGRITESRIGSSSTVLVDGANCDECEITRAAYVDLRNFSGNFQRNNVGRGRVYLGGSAGNVTDCSWDSLSYFYARNCTGLTFQYFSSQGYSYINIDRAVSFNCRYIGLRDVSYLYGRDSQNVSMIRLTGENQGVIDLDSANGLVLQYAVAVNSATIRLERATGRIRYAYAENRGLIDGRDFTGDWYDLKVSNQSTLNIREATRTGCYKVVVDNQSNCNFQGSNSLVRRCKFSANYLDDRNGNNQLVDCDFSQGAQYTRGGSGEYYDCAGKSYPYLNGIGAPQGRATRVNLTSFGRLRTNNAVAGWTAIDCNIDAQSDLRIENSGRTYRTSLSARAILYARQTGTIDRAVVMQVSSVQTANSTNLRLHAGGAF